MRTFAAGVLIVGLCLLAGAGFSQAQGKTETVTGQVVDLVCYARNNANTGVDHEEGRVCAIACVRWEGNPVGIVTSSGKVYQLAGGLTANSNVKVSPHLSHTVTVTGPVHEKDGMLILTADELKMAK
jgi:hypothetical protein